MRRLAIFIVSLLILANGCVISPRRTVGSTTGSGGGNSEFSLAVNPTTQTITAGASATYTVNVTAVNGFTGTVNLSASSSVAGIVASFSTTSITGGSGSATLTAQTTSTTSTGTATITVFASNPSNSVSQSVSVTATVAAAASTADAIVSASGGVVPAGCINSPASPNVQRVSFPASPSTGFTAIFVATPSAAMDASLGFFTPAFSGRPSLSSLIRFSPAGVIQIRDGDAFSASPVPYSAGQTYHFRLVENLPTVTYSAFVTPPGAAEIPLGTNLPVPSAQRGMTTLTGWGIQINSPEGATLSVCDFSLGQE